MKRVIILLILSLLVCEDDLQSQELVYDGGFEKINLFTAPSGKLNFEYENWVSIIPVEHFTRNGAPYYPEFLRRRPDADESTLSTYKPFSGDAYLTTLFCYLKNLHQSALLKPIQKDSIYEISFKFKVIADYYKKEKIEESINSKIGVFFSTRSLHDSIGLNLFIGEKKLIKPHVALDGYIHKGEERWQSFTETWKADKDYHYIIVGNFEKIIESSEVGYHFDKGVTYRIDELSAKKCSSSFAEEIGKERISENE